MPYLFDYHNYRDFLKDIYVSKKSKNPKFSYRVLSRVLGFASPNFLKLVILGDRNLSESSIKKISTGLKFEELEKDYFKVLVSSNQCKDMGEKQDMVDRLSYLTTKANEKVLDEQFQKFLSHWYYPVIREMITLSKFKEDPKWISMMLNGKVTVEQVGTAISDMLDMGLLSRDDEDELVQAEKTLATDPEAVRVCLKRTHHEFIHKAAESIEGSHPIYRDISSLTVGMNKHSFDKAKGLIQKFRQDLNILLSKEENVDAVYQANFQLFNLTPVNWEEDKGIES